jgi:hypothetical protein
MRKIANILFILFFVGFAGNCQDKTETKKHHLLAGFNLATPFGSKKQGTYPFSYISSNLNLSFYGEYRMGNFGVKIPVRLPLTQIDTAFLNASYENYYYYETRYLRNTKFELGIKPVAYLGQPDDLFQVFVGAALYYGRHDYIVSEQYIYYTQDSGSGLYEIYDKTERFQEFVGESYFRWGLVSGVQWQFKNRVGIASDLDIFYGRKEYAYSTIYSNEGTTDGVLFRRYWSNESRNGISSQFNLYLTYRFL